MLSLIWKLTRGYRLTPWRSPYLRWRLETYTGIHAETLDFAQFWAVSWKYRTEFWRYLRWAERMSN